MSKNGVKRTKLKKRSSEKSKGTYVPRHKEKYPALNFRRQVAVRKEILDDIDYIQQLRDIEDPKERKKVLDFMNSFLEETVIANFKHKGKHIYTKEEQKQFGRENNYRNLDLYGKLKAMHQLNYSGTVDTMTFLNKELANLTVSDIENAILTKMELGDNSDMIDQEMTSEFEERVKEQFDYTIDKDVSKRKKRLLKKSID
jgi:hypothetical protein